jgi:uncharacterized protein (TIGR00375 family)
MSFVADLHIHSPYAYGASSALTLDNLAAWAKLKGIQVLATSDFTHPIWFRHLKDNLQEGRDGAYQYGGVNFVMGTEISCVFRQEGRGRRVHILIYAPDLATAEALTAAYAKYGNLDSDGRPTLSLSARDAAYLTLEVNPDCLIVPAHAWTPWYGIFGAKSGFDSLSEAFGDLVDQVPAIETGLSSDPEMNWHIPDLADKTIVSFSDAHSLPRLGREMTVFQDEPTFLGLRQGLTHNRVEFTVEMYPEEGKYHFDGHRKCGISWRPDQTLQKGNACPVCGRPLTLGVLHRAHDLRAEGADGRAGSAPANLNTPAGSLPVNAIRSEAGRPPFVRMVPLVDLISAVTGRGPNTKGVQRQYAEIVAATGSEFHALLRATESELATAGGETLASAIIKVRNGDIQVEPGYDGVYGKVSIPSLG